MSKNRWWQGASSGEAALAREMARAIGMNVDSDAGIPHARGTFHWGVLREPVRLNRRGDSYVAQPALVMAKKKGSRIYVVIDNETKFIFVKDVESREEARRLVDEIIQLRRVTSAWLEERGFEDALRA